MSEPITIPAGFFPPPWVPFTTDQQRDLAVAMHNSGLLKVEIRDPKVGWTNISDYLGIADPIKYRIAAPEPPLADWANAQPAFRALAQILIKGRLYFNGREWILAVGRSTYGTKLPPPPNGLPMKSLELSNGQWTDAP